MKIQALLQTRADLKRASVDLLDAIEARDNTLSAAERKAHEGLISAGQRVSALIDENYAHAERETPGWRRPSASGCGFNRPYSV